MSDNGFTRRESGGVFFYTCRALEHIPGVTHGFSTRVGGVSSLPANSLNLTFVDWDTPAAVSENRTRFFSALRLNSVPLATLSQIHSDRIHLLQEVPASGDRPSADAVATRAGALAIGVQVADCFPVLIADRRGTGIAAVHAGWRGTVQRIAAKTVNCMMAEFAIPPQDLVAAIGPGIRPCCFEVGNEVSTRFDEAFPGVPLHSSNPDDPSRRLLDLPRALRLQLVQAGLPERQIYDLGLCTMCNRAEFFSYRGDGPCTGRLMAVIARDA